MTTTMIALVVLFATMTTTARTADARSVGILYEVWHSASATSMAMVKSRGHEQLTVERVIRSDGAKTLNDVYGAFPAGTLPSLDIWNVEPAELGFYCLYRKRENDTAPPVPDCTNTSGVARRHADLLTNLGVDYIAVDITNWPQANDATDLAVMRPLEVLFEEWTTLRSVGVQTPYISVWPAAPVASYADGHETTWKLLLDRFYNDATYEPLIWRRPSAGGTKKTFFVTANSFLNTTVNALIASNSGRDDIDLLPMWALFGKDDFDQGRWAFFSPCVDGKSFTTSMILPSATNRSALAECNQYTTLNADGSTELTASGGYMLSQAALPFAAPGHMRGLVVQRMFKKILATRPPDVFLSSWNEHIGGRQKAAYGSAVAFNQGLPNDPQKSVWVDTYASEFSRDIEPTVEGGTAVYDMTASCVAMYKDGRTCSDPANKDELCCSTASTYIWSNVWSLNNTATGDGLLTTNVAERDTLVAAGSWKELCATIGGPTAFCVDAADTDGRHGPFMIYNAEDALKGRPDGASAIPLYRCIAASNVTHFVSTDAACEGLGSVESRLGWMSDRRGSETLRELRRCPVDDGRWTHALDLPCDETSGSGGGGDRLGFVR